ncbi:MAG: CHAT domain-containing protein [Leptospirales bacterium]|nr:CHAT domain-containing protein [Leptospirales bacterium]
MEFLNILIDRVDKTNVFNVMRGRMPSRESHLQAVVDEDLIQEYLGEIDRLNRIAAGMQNEDSNGIFDLTVSIRRLGESFFLQFFPEPVQDLLRAERGFLFLHVDSKLRRIPWDLLHDGSCFLSDKFYIGKNISGHWRETQHVERENLRVLIVCDPTEDLAWARKEGEGLFDALSGQVGPDKLDIQFLSGKSITKLSLLDAMKDRDVIHYAGHIRSSRDPRESGWLLSEERVLRTREIEKAGFSPDLLFANGCSVQNEDENDSVDVASAFLRAGISNFIGTNWEIKDSRHTLDFAVNFYRSIFEEKSIGESLFDARQTARRSYPPADLTWANYVLHGNPMARIYRNAERRTFHSSVNILNVRRILEEYPAPIAGEYARFQELQNGPASDRANMEMLNSLIETYESTIYITASIVFAGAISQGFRAEVPENNQGLDAWVEKIYTCLSNMKALKMEPPVPGLPESLTMHRENIEKLLGWRNGFRAGEIGPEDASSYVITFQYLFENLLADLNFLRRILLLYAPPDGAPARVLQGVARGENFRILPHENVSDLTDLEASAGRVLCFSSMRRALFSLDSFLKYDSETGLLKYNLEFS